MTTPKITAEIASAVKSEYADNEYRNAVREKLARERESLRLYEPMKIQDDFHRCAASQAVMQKGNRTGGTLSLMVEVARAVTGQDPYKKYPTTDGRCILIGLGEKHIGRTFHRFLFRAGAFSIIRDEETQKWRTYRPWPKATKIEGKFGDLEREKEKKQAPPLIPKRFIRSVSWEKKSEYIFSVVSLINGWEIHAFNSAGDPGQAQGFDAHLTAIDEDLSNPGWYEEVLGRRVGVEGLLRWAAIPHAKNNQLMDLIELAELQEDMPNPDAVVFRASILDNVYISQRSIEKSIAGWKALGEDVYKKRVLGEIVLDSVLMYPTYSRRLHSAIKRDDEVCCEVQRIISERQGEPPDDWTRVMIVDPGFTVCSILFGAIPPPEIGRQRVIYQEYYLRNATAAIFGEALDASGMKDKVFEKFIIDMHGASLTSSGDGQKPLERYTDELVMRKIRSEQTGMAFAAGVDRVKLREECLRGWLSLERDGFPTLLIVNERCPNLVRELEKFRKKTVKQNGVDVPIDEGNRRANTHAVECAEYFAADGLEYVQPRTHAIRREWVDVVLEQDARRAAERKAQGVTFDTSHITLGPQGAPVT